MSQEFVKSIVDYIQGLKSLRLEKSAPQNLPAGIAVEHFRDVKVVSKPWGFEMWLAFGKDFPYALKMIYIKKGTKTSLQYHQNKREHNVIFAGKVRLHYKDSKTGEVVAQEFHEGSIIQVDPPSIHRMEALTDLFLIEVSTHHLDDVIRVSDDYQRPDGKIESEHKKSI